MKQLQKFSKFLSDYTSIVVIAIAVITFFLPSLMGWVNFQLFTDPVANKFTSQSIIIGVIMFSMGLTLTLMILRFWHKDHLTSVSEPLHNI